jgi:ATP-dependent Clp protease ATP-binding subunit ClpA
MRKVNRDSARPLKRVIQRRIQDPLAMKVLAGEVHDGDHVLVDADEAGFTFTPTQAPAEVEEPVPVG